MMLTACVCVCRFVDFSDSGYEADPEISELENKVCPAFLVLSYMHTPHCLCSPPMYVCMLV